MIKLRTLAATLLLAASAVNANAGVWNEVGDAGDTPGTAQVASGIGALDTIFGALGVATDTDVFKIYVADTAAFSITMNGTNLSVDNDTQLYVLDTLGNLLFEDDDSGPGALSQLNAGDFAAFAAGNYLVAYNIFYSSPIDSPVIGWDVNPGPEQTGPVQLNFTGAQFVAVPEPASGALLAVAMAGVALARRRARRNAQ
jgi:hypothetical protein